jgi:N-acetylneuraminate synthase
MKQIKLVDKWIGDGYPCYMIAEIGGSFHNFDEAKRLIDAAAEISVDAVKFQTLEADTITTKQNTMDLEVTGYISQYDFFKEFEVSKKLQKKVVKYANDCGITIFSAPSHIKDINTIEEMELPVYKIGSDLACHIPLLKEVSKTGKPIILSTGMCTMVEITNSVDAIVETGNKQLALLHCVSDYPTKFEEANINAILSLKEKFDFPIGYSDHTVGTIMSLGACALGANILERHFRDPLNSAGVDDIMSLTKEQFAELIQNVRILEKGLGTGEKVPTKSEQKNLLTNRVSIVANKTIPKNTIITEEILDIKRPGTGIAPIHFEKLLGRKSKAKIKFEEPLTWDKLI